MQVGDADEYHARREKRQVQLADAESDPANAAIHRDLAARYSQLATETAAPVVRIAGRYAKLIGVIAARADRL